MSLGFASVMVISFPSHSGRWLLASLLLQLSGRCFQDPLVPFTAGVIALSVMATTTEGETQDWFSESWGFAKQILPLLLFGVLIAGFLLDGR